VGCDLSHACVLDAEFFPQQCDLLAGVVELCHQAQPGDGAVDGPAANFRQGQSRQGNGVQHGRPDVAVPVFG